MVNEGFNRLRDEFPLFIACQNGYARTAEVLIRHGFSINAQVLLPKQNSILRFRLKVRKSDGAPPLFVAAQNGHLDVVKYLVEHGAAIDSPRNTGATPLFIACQHGHTNVATYLIKKGAQVSAPTKKV